MSRVLWRDAQGVEGALDLGPGELFVGRSVECAIRTDDAMVSRKHARLFWEGGQFYVEDLGSANGVFYQEKRVSRHALNHGDAVRCGSLWLRYIDAAGSAGGRRAPSPSSPPAPSPAPAAAPSPSAPAAPREAPRPAAASDNEEVRRLRRRVEQLQAELKIYRGGGKGASQMEGVEKELARVEEERDQLKDKVAALETQIATEGGDVKVQRAGAIAQTAGETVDGLNDVLSNLRINIMAAEGEFDQYAQAIPRASFELIREALRSSAIDMDTAREMLRKLREL